LSWNVFLWKFSSLTARLEYTPGAIFEGTAKFLLGAFIQYLGGDRVDDLVNL
jgi:hypothetical protein